MWLRNKGLQRVVGQTKALRNPAIRMLRSVELALLNGHKDHRSIDVIRHAGRGREMLLTGNEAFLIYAMARAQAKWDADMAEVGVFEGGSAELICEGKGECALHLFDTFDGLPEPEAKERDVLATHQFTSSLPRVQARLARYAGVHYHRGTFPDTASAVADRRFSFVHLDVDLQSSTRAGLEFFYPRMIRGGLILSHDFSVLPGVADAFHAFLADKPEPAIELPTTQVLVVKA